MILRTIAKTISLSSILFIGTAAAFAQSASGITPPPSSQEMPPAPGQPTSNGNVTSTTGNQPPTASLADQAFLQDILRDNQAQLQMSRLAQQKSSSDDVKQLSQRMVKLQTSLNDQLKTLAQRLSIVESGNPSKQEKQELAKLEQLSGQDFDTAYLQAMVKAQEHNLKEFKQESEGSQDPTIQHTAQADTPILNQNFQSLQQIAQTHNVPLDEKK